MTKNPQKRQGLDGKSPLLLLVCIAILATTTAHAELNDNITSYYTFDNTNTSGGQALDSTSNNFDALIENSLQTGISGRVDEAYNFTETNDRVRLNDSQNIGASIGNNFTVVYWAKLRSVDDFDTTIELQAGTQDFVFGFNNNASGTTRDFRFFCRDPQSDGGSVTVGADANPRPSLNQPFMAVARKSGNTSQVFFNATLVDNETVSNWGDCMPSNENLTVGRDDDFGGREIDGYIDEVAIWNRSLTTTEISNLYNNGNANQYPFINLTSVALNETTPNELANVTANTTLQAAFNQSVTITANWTNATNTLQTQTFSDTLDGDTVTTEINLDNYSLDDGDTVNITFEAEAADNATNNLTITNTGTIRINATKVHPRTGDFVQNFSTMQPRQANTTNGTIVLNNVDLGTRTVEANATQADYLNVLTNTSVSVKVAESTNITLRGFFDHNLTVNATLKPTGNRVLNFTSQVGDLAPFVTKKSNNTGQVNYHILQGLTYNVSIPNSTDAATRRGNGSLIMQTRHNASTQQKVITFETFESESLNLEFRRETTDTILNTTKITVEFISDSDSQTNTTTNGTLNTVVLEPLTYEIRYDADGFNTNSYYKHIDNQSFNNLTLYLINNTKSDTVIFNNEDESGNPVEGVTLQLLREYIENNNSIFRIVEMDRTDFSGEAVTNLELTNAQYRIRVFNNVNDKEKLLFTEKTEITNTVVDLPPLRLLGNPLQSFNTYRGIDYGNPSYDNTTKEWTVTYDASTGSTILNEMCLKVERFTALNKKFHGKTCSNATTATLTVFYNNTAFDSDAGSIATVTFDTTTNNTEYIGAVSEYWSSSRSNLADTLGNNGPLFAAIIIGVIGSTLTAVGPAGIIYGSIVGLIGTFALGFISATLYTTIIPMIIIGFIVAIRVST